MCAGFGGLHTVFKGETAGGKGLRGRDRRKEGVGRSGELKNQFKGKCSHGHPTFA